MIKAKLFVLGTQRELLSTDLECYRTRNATTGRPGPIPMGGLVTLAFTSGYGDDRLLYALLHSPEGELCTLTTTKIVFYAGDLNGVVLFEYRLKDAAFIYWKEEFNAVGEAPMTVTVAISAAIQEIKGITWVKPWRESEVLSEEGVVREKGVQREVLGDYGRKGDGGVLGGVVLEAKPSSRAFFSGIGTEARAIKEGFTTLSQTRAGQNIMKMTKGMPYYPGSQAYNWWARLSSTYAKGIPKGSNVNVFLNNPSPTGIWNTVEKPILQQRSINITYK